MARRAQAARTPSGVPPIPKSTSIPVWGRVAISAAATSPSLMKRILAPARRTSFFSFSCRGRSNMMTVKSWGLLSRALAMLRKLSTTGFSISIDPLLVGPTAILSIYTKGPGSYIVPFGDRATVAIEFKRPSARGRVPSIGSTAISISGNAPVPSSSPL